MEPHRVSNNTQFEIKSAAERYCWAGWLVAVSLCSLLGDSTILIASTRFRVFKFPRLVVTAIQHIAVSDLVICVLHVPNICSLVLDRWVLGETLCYLEVYLGYVLYTAGTLLICTMTVGKLLTLKCPLRYTFPFCYSNLKFVQHFKKMFAFRLFS